MTSYDDKLYNAIGRFIVAFSQLEHTLKFYLAEGIGLKEDDFQSVMSAYDFRVLCDVTIDVYSRQLAPENVQRLTEIIKHCHKLHDQRNHIAHGLWTPNKKAGHLVRGPRGASKSKRYFTKPDEIESLVSEAWRLNADFEKTIRALPPLHRASENHPARRPTKH